MLGGWPRCLKINHAFKTKLQCLCARVQSIVSVHYIRKILPPENPKNHDCTRYGICHKWHKFSRINAKNYQFGRICQIQVRVKKTRIFYGQADRNGEVSTLGPDSKQMWKFWPTKKGLKQCFGPKNTCFLHGQPDREISVFYDSPKSSINFYIWYDIWYSLTLKKATGRPCIESG